MKIKLSSLLPNVDGVILLHFHRHVCDHQWWTPSHDLDMLDVGAFRGPGTTSSQPKSKWEHVLRLVIKLLCLQQGNYDVSLGIPSAWSPQLVHTHLDSSELGFPWARPDSWWAGDCAGTEIPILSCMMFHTYTLTHWQSLQETSPVASCLGSCTRSHRQWQNQPGSERVGLHPKEHPSPACRRKWTMQMSATRLRAFTTLFMCLFLRIKRHNCRYHPRNLMTQNWLPSI